MPLFSKKNYVYKRFSINCLPSEVAPQYSFFFQLLLLLFLLFVDFIQKATEEWHGEKG